MSWFSTCVLIIAIGVILFRVMAAIKQHKEHSTSLQLVKSWKPAGKSIAWENERFLVLINPFGGHKNALQRVYLSIVRPMLAIARVDHDATVTTHAGHAREIARTVDVTKYAAIITVSGDGLLHEVVSGLHDRINDRVTNEMGLNITTAAGQAAVAKLTASLFERLSLGVIPAGTSNGFSASISRFRDDHHDDGKATMAKDPFSAMVRILSTRGRPIDILTVNGAPQPVNATKWWDNAAQAAATKLQAQGGVWDLMIGSLGIVSHVDSLAEETMRSFPKWIKQSYIPLHVVAWKLSFAGQVSFKPVWPIPGNDENERPKVHPANQDGFIAAKVTGGYNHPGRLPECPIRGPDWRVINDQFVMVSALNVPDCADDFCLAPAAKPASGSFDLLIMRSSINRAQMIRILIGMETGAHTVLPHFEYYRVTDAYVYPDMTNHTFVDVSGARYPLAPVHISVLPRLARVIY